MAHPRHDVGELAELDRQLGDAHRRDRQALHRVVDRLDGLLGHRHAGSPQATAAAGSAARTARSSCKGMTASGAKPTVTVSPTARAAGTPGLRSLSRAPAACAGSISRLVNAPW